MNSFKLYLRAPASLVTCEGTALLDFSERVVFLDSSERLVFLPKLVQGELEDSSVDLFDIHLFWLVGVDVVDVVLITIESAVRAAKSCEYLDKTPVGCV